MLHEFVEFLKEYKIVGLAVGFIMATAATTLVNSLVNDVLMPIAAPFLSAESWKTAVLHIGPVSIAYGSFIAELLNFIILALIVFLVAKKILKMQAQK